MKIKDCSTIEKFIIRVCNKDLKGIWFLYLGIWVSTLKWLIFCVDIKSFLSTHPPGKLL